MSFVNDYQLIHCALAKNMRTGEYMDSARMFIGPGIGGDEPDYGHCIRKIFDTDNLSMMRIPSAPGLKSPAKPGYVYHGESEIEYCLYGDRRLSYPDGTKHLLYPGTAFMHAAGQPHAMEGLSIGESGVLCFHSCRLKDVDRSLWPAGKYLKQDGGYVVTHCWEAPAVEGGDPLVVVKEIAETYKMCFRYVTIKPGGCTPKEHFICNNVDQIIFVISGSGVAVYPDKSYMIETEVTAYNKAGQPYKLINTGEEDLNLAVVYHAEFFREVVQSELRVSDLKNA